METDDNLESVEKETSDELAQEESLGVGTDTADLEAGEAADKPETEEAEEAPEGKIV
jgi:hypothetical protein